MSSQTVLPIFYQSYLLPNDRSEWRCVDRTHEKFFKQPFQDQFFLSSARLSIYAKLPGLLFMFSPAIDEHGNKSNNTSSSYDRPRPLRTQY